MDVLQGVVRIRYAKSQKFGILVVILFTGIPSTVRGLVRSYSVSDFHVRR